MPIIVACSQGRIKRGSSRDGAPAPSRVTKWKGLKQF
jgi:hypothetical protein